MIAAYGDQVVMEETLARALSALFGGSAPAPPYLEIRQEARTRRSRNAAAKRSTTTIGRWRN